VLEIGPGRGALTIELSGRVKKLYALEFDRGLAEMHRNRFAGRDDVTVVEDDALNVDFRAFAPTGENLRLIANLPYNISTAILQRLFAFQDVFTDCVLMFQREVVDRITAPPGTKDRGFLTVLTEAYFSVDLLFDVPRTAFRPVPKVWSSVVRLEPKAQIPPYPELFRTLISTAFGQKRKTILNNLRTVYPEAEEILRSGEIDPRRRAESLGLDEWYRLADAAFEHGSGDPSG
jgi:16S rRNA (adenine1518-N6/adenine1519-N6)-dimethyltransferase